ncbi:T9SS type A sorting domain-containing protein [Psychroflexus torquis]|uniref:T9SS type A sorting domain-containing protein n=1 Tax=Psychroflexus torquis TaxID=57029 RepID=UPI0000D529E4|nr:T9SS type A sorting domain-containing protein [Psychroflexus torquis]
MSINNEEVELFTVYPNPTKEIININSEYSQRYTIIVYDIFGKVLIQEEKTTNKTKLDLSNLINGVYLVSFQDGLKRYSVKIIKQ